MQKYFLSVLLLLVTSISVKAATTDNKPVWLTQLEQCDIIDSIIDVSGTSGSRYHRVAYHIYYHQPVNHDDPTGEQFQLRCSMVMPDDADPATCAAEVYFQGYDINSLWRFPVYCLDFTQMAEITSRYKGALFMPEHRYFSESSPKECWTKLEYCNAKEAAQDFHALIQAMKTSFKGKWVLTGISKGGDVTAIQHAYYPEDADLFVPNCGPICHGMSDPGLHKYITSTGWTEEMRDRLNNTIKGLLEDTEAIDIFSMFERQENPERTDDECRKLYYENVLNIPLDAHAYVARSKVNGILDNNDTMRVSIINKYDFAPYNANSYLNALYAQTQKLDATTAWKQFLSASVKVREEYPVYRFSVKKDEWESNELMAYYCQVCTELGTYGFDFHNIYTQPEDQVLADSLQNFYYSGENLFSIYFPFFNDVEFDGTLNSNIEQTTKDATKPIIYLYGEDDCWTGCAIDDEFINGDTSHKFILSAQYHGVGIGYGTEEEQNEIWPLIDAVMSTTGINVVETKTKADTNCYNLVGQRVTPTAKGIVIRNGKKFLVR